LRDKVMKALRPGGGPRGNNPGGLRNSGDAVRPANGRPVQHAGSAPVEAKDATPPPDPRDGRIWDKRAGGVVGSTLIISAVVTALLRLPTEVPVVFAVLGTTLVAAGFGLPVLSIKAAGFAVGVGSDARKPKPKKAADQGADELAG
jgi:hypothetical protein